MTTTLFRAAFVGVTVSAIAAGYAPSVRAADRFEVASIKAVRPTLVRTVDALQKNNPKAAKEAFGDFDSAWNGIEVYINTRSPEMYNALERDLQAKITAGLNESSPNVANMLALRQDDAREIRRSDRDGRKGPAARPAVRRRRAAADRPRAPARGEPGAQGRRSRRRRASHSGEFDEKWDSIEDLIKERDIKAYNMIEDGMTQIGLALKQASPDVAKCRRSSAA